MTSNHEKFLGHLDASKEAVHKVAEWMSGFGFAVTLPPLSKAKTASEWKEHADSGDLFIQQRIEVKRLSVEFHSREDWPFKNKFIVCAKHAFDNALPKPFAYVILNSGMTHAAVVKTDSAKRWTVERRTDSRYEGVSQDFYMASLDDVAFKAI